VFILLDYAMNRGKAINTVPVVAPQRVPAESGGDLAEGFHVPQSLSYHPSHSWLICERKNVGKRY
jgi:hypothetical protein